MPQVHIPSVFIILSWVFLVFMNKPASGNFTFSAKPVKTEHLSKPIKPRCSVYTGFTVLDLTKKTILANHKSFMPSMNILINEEYDDLSTLILDAKIPCKESIADSSTCSTKELSIAMTSNLSTVNE